MRSHPPAALARRALASALLACTTAAACGAGGPIDRALFGRPPTRIPPAPQRMDVETLLQLLRQEGEDVRVADGTVELTYRSVRMVCVASERFDRLRLYAPIKELDALTDEERERALEANFRSLLDVRYATHGGMLHAVYLHPLSGLTSLDVRSALYQVANAATSFGSDYSSGVFYYTEPGERF